jgi:hypothetical protein
MLRARAVAGLFLPLSLALAGCPSAAPSDGVDSGAGTPTNVDAAAGVEAGDGAVWGDARSEFDAKYAAFVARVQQDDMLNRSGGAYAELPEFAAIVGMGKRGLPFVFEKIAAGDFSLNRAAALVTGVNVYAALRSDPANLPWGPGRPPIGAQDGAKLWADWWAAHRDDPAWRP